jgi:hypothetical protein
MHRPSLGAFDGYTSTIFSYTEAALIASECYSKLPTSRIFTDSPRRSVRRQSSAEATSASTSPARA